MSGVGYIMLVMFIHNGWASDTIILLMTNACLIVGFSFMIENVNK